MKAWTAHMSEEELERWKAAAEMAKLPFNRWIRRALNERAELEKALERERRRLEQRGE